MKHGSLFSGVGGCDLAAQWMGWENVFHCEINPFGRKVLNYYWPEAVSYEDITKTDFTIWRGKVDILTGGFPCQPFSAAGKRKGTEDDRHLWPEMLRAIREIQPRYVVGENVPGLINWSGGLVFEQVQTDLEDEGYEVWPVILPACGKNAPHLRQRIWFVAHATGNRDNRTSGKTSGKIRGQNRDEAKQLTKRSEIRPASDTENIGLQFTGQAREWWTGLKNGNKRNGVTANTKRIGQQGQRRAEHASSTKKKGNWKASWSYDDDRWPTVSPVCSRNDGFPGGLDNITFPKWRNESLKAMGNAIVPQVVYEVFRAIEETERYLEPF